MILILHASLLLAGPFRFTHLMVRPFRFRTCKKTMNLDQLPLARTTDGDSPSPILMGESWGEGSLSAPHSHLFASIRGWKNSAFLETSHHVRHHRLHR